MGDEILKPGAGTPLESPDLSVELGPITLAHPFVNASGTMELLELAEQFGEDVFRRPPVAAYVPKTVTLEPRSGNAPPRILETPAGMINAIGLSGEGVRAFIAQTLPRLVALPCPLIVSIGGFSVQEYVSLARRLREAVEELLGAGWQARVGLELNISCPNVHSGCLLIGAEPRETEAVVTAVRAEWPGLLVAKLTPNVTDISAVAYAAQEAGVDAVAAVNTYKGLVIDRRSLKPLLGNIGGGVSGSAIKPLALRAVFDVFARVRIPVIGMGGISTVQDALDMMACGARVVAVGSAGLRDPWTVSTLAEQLGEELRVRDLDLLSLVGLAHR